ncbi:MAG: hypothetical protein IT160_20775 [Bryobacterales bacterium]|nr:hypothetical protein [Bryobacterales bacterium]
MAGINEQLGELLSTLYQPTKEVAAELTAFGSTLRESLGRSTATVNTVASRPEQSAGDNAYDAVTPVLKTVLGGLPLVSGLLSLFGGREESAAVTPLPKFALPPAIRANTGLFQGGEQVGAIDYDDRGIPRMLPPNSNSDSAAPMVTINVQAMDSRSFLDRSDDIADAVKKALLNSHPLTDLVG